MKSDVLVIGRWKLGFGGIVRNLRVIPRLILVTIISKWYSMECAEALGTRAHNQPARLEGLGTRHRAVLAGEISRNRSARRPAAHQHIFRSTLQKNFLGRLLGCCDVFSVLLRRGESPVCRIRASRTPSSGGNQPDRTSCRVSESFLKAPLEEVTQ